MENLLPIAIRVAAKTISNDLVSVNPLFMKDNLLKEAEIKVSTINRERKLNSIVNDVKYEEYKIEETEEYKKYEEKRPKVMLHYLDYMYTSPIK